MRTVMQPSRSFKVLVTALTIFLPSFFSLLCSSENGQFSIMRLGAADEVQEILKYSFDYGKTWNDYIIDKVSTCENGNWTSLSMSSSGNAVLATRECSSNDKTNDAQENGMEFIVVFAVSSGDNSVKTSWKSLSNNTGNNKSFFSDNSTRIQTIDASDTQAHMYISNGYDIFKSSDYGVSWETSLDLRREIDTNQYVVLKTSDNGQYIYALLHYSTMDVENDLDDGMGYTYSSVLYMSSDFGENWDVVVQSLTTSKGVNSLWVSNDGQYVMCSSGTNMVLYSRDYGKLFVNLLLRSNAVFSSSAVTNSTTTLFNGNNISEWQEYYKLFHNLLEVSAVSMSHNGHHIVLAAKSVTLENMLLFSRDGGHSWSKQPAPTSDLRHMTVDSEGKRVIGMLQDGTITVIGLTNALPASSVVTNLPRRQPE